MIYNIILIKIQVKIGERLLAYLIYADDTLLLSKSAVGLHKLLNKLLPFCQT